MTAKHSRTQHFVQAGLFNNLQAFSALESRIAQLETNQERGDAFEVFAQGYLATQKIVQATQVWPFDKIPEKVKQSIAISTPRDMGVDGVIETTIGEHAAYQVKYRTGRPSLTWDELSTFMGLTEQANERVLFTNCDDLPALMNDRENFFCIRGSDLDRLEARDFESIREWLHTGYFTPRRKTPLPHQNEALQAVQSALSEADRATLVMACGTGKTLVALWAAERLAVRLVLVLVPSLALVRQTLHEWLKETSWSDFSFLCVCSDPTVARGDELIVHQADLDFPVTTDSDVVREYLSSTYDGVRVVFSTYQSAQVVAEGIGDEPFDLGLFDEAHKTTGREGTRFSFALNDKNLPISKRLFMTATPRHYDVRKKDKEGDAKLVYSMDVPETYGQIAHTLSFREAATRDIICDYKVCISVVTSSEVNDDLLRRGEVIVQEDAVKARQVANQIALRRAVEQHGVQRIFTFHSSVASAKSFTGPGGEGVNSELPDFLAVHVNGKLPTAKRELILQDFAQADKAVISNARCLTEGVDLPAVDMVAFMAPKKSKVDIVQATGRAMRKAGESKKFGYVMVPLYVEQEAGESIEEALKRTGFDEVWNVLGAMKEQGDVLADIIRQMREDKGRVGGYDDARFHEHVEVLGPSVSLASLRDAITALCVERLGATWDERFGQLVSYKNQHGDCDVPVSWRENPSLGIWVAEQRKNRRNRSYRRLNQERIQRLDILGFTWEILDAAWEKMYQALTSYKSQHGHCNVPKSWSENPSLVSWVLTQRRLKHDGGLSRQRIQRLEQLGFTWDFHEESWETKYQALMAYKKLHGHCNIPYGWAEDPKLARWVSLQRRQKRIRTLSQDRFQRLDVLGFAWEPDEAAWEQYFQTLVVYKNQHGHCNVPKDSSGNPELSTWVNNQRTTRRKGKLSAERIKRLDELDFAWEPDNAAWEEMYQALTAYKSQHGHCNVPQRWTENPKLGTWVSNHRTLKSNGRLSEERFQRLDELGLAWSVNEARWEEMFSNLVKYRKQHGDCNVPRHWPENPKLGIWVTNIRTAKQSDTLSNEHTQRLEELGFIWKPKEAANEAAWEEMFKALKDYKKQHGDCNVPQGSSQNRKLASWVRRQRASKRKGKLSQERIQRLEALGFEWTLVEARE